MRNRVLVTQRSHKPCHAGSNPASATKHRSLAQPVRASALGAEGQRLKSFNSDHTNSQ
jgi:hypothetical protein